jgi:hypothetical protein
LRSFYIYFRFLILLSVFFHSSPPTYIVSIFLHRLPQTQYNKPSSLIHAHHPEGEFLPVMLSIGDDDDNVDDADDPPTVQEKFKSRVNERDMNV